MLSGYQQISNANDSSDDVGNAIELNTLDSDSVIDDTSIHIDTSTNPHPLPSTNRSQSSPKAYNVSQIVFNAVAIIVFFFLNHRVSTLQVENVSLVKQINDYKASNSDKLTVISDDLKSIHVAVSTHGDIIKRLSNGTSNADVLDKMVETKGYVNQQLDTTKVELYRSLLDTKKEVNNTIALTKNELSTTELRVKENLAKTEHRVNDVVNDATTKIQSVQGNVTLQLAAMGQTLTVAVDKLNSVVTEAQETIQVEMDAVRDNIDKYVAVTNKQFAAENDFVKYQLAGTFTLLACIISFWHLTSHAGEHFHRPAVQKRIMAVLWMVPMYSVTSWLSLVFTQFEVLFAFVRDSYEAYAVYTFIALLIAILDDEKGLPHLLDNLARQVINERKAVREAIENNLPKPAQHLIPPFPCCYIYHKPYTVAAAWLRQCQLLAMQFVLMKPLLSSVPFLLKLYGIDYDNIPIVSSDSHINWLSPKIYLIVLQNLSVALAFYGLLSFYHGTEEELEWCNPWPKFLVIKGVVFMTFWQGAIIQMMSTAGMVENKAALQIQNLLTCIEMLIASVAHFYIFPYSEWEDGYKERVQHEIKTRIRFRDTLALGDFGRDIYSVVTPWHRAGSSVNDNESDVRSNISIRNSLEGINTMVSMEEDGILKTYEEISEGSVHYSSPIVQHFGTSNNMNSEESALLDTSNAGYGAVDRDNYYEDSDDRDADANANREMLNFSAYSNTDVSLLSVNSRHSLIVEDVDSISSSDSLDNASV